MELRNGVTDSASRVPFRRWIEVELHHVDLGIGYELEDLPAEFVEREIDFLADRFAGHPEVPHTRVTDGTRAWSTGRGVSGDQRLRGSRGLRGAVRRLTVDRPHAPRPPRLARGPPRRVAR